MATLLGSTGDPGDDRYQGYAYDCKIAIPLTLPAGGPWRIPTLGARLAGDSTHFGSTTVYLMIWDASGNLIGQSASFVPTNRAYPESDVYEKAVSSPPQVNGGATVYVGFGFVWASGKGLQWECDYGAVNYSTANHTVPGPLSSKYSETLGKPAAWLYYEAANQAPSAPDQMTPTGGALTSLTPTLHFRHVDPDGNDMASYDLQVDDNSDFSSPLWDIASQTTGKSGSPPNVVVDRAYGGSGLNRGSTYYWRARTRDPGGLTGPWSTAQSFKVLSVPVVTLTEPSAASRLCRTAYSAGAGWASPRLYPEWSFTCPDGGTEHSWELEVANDSGGNPSGYLYQSGEVHNTAQSLIVPANLTEAAYYHVRVRAVCTHGEVSNWSGYFRTRARWGATHHRLDLGSAPASWAIAGLTTTTPANTAVEVEYNSSPDGTTLGTWRAALADVPVQRWFHYRVVLRAWGASPATSPSLDYLALSYSQLVLVPDNWTRQTPAECYVTTEAYVYGTQSLRMNGAGAAHHNAYQQITVLPFTDYILSGRIKSLGASGGKLIIGDSGTGGVLAQSDAADETADWTRVNTPIWNSGANTSVWVRCYVSGDVDTVAWFDALKMEASRVVTPWQPGYVGRGAVVDAGGIQIDASDGGLFRLRGSIGGTRDRVDLGGSGLVFGGDTQILSPSTGVIEGPSFFKSYGLLLAGLRINGAADSGGKWAKIAHGSLTQQYYSHAVMGRVHARYDDVFADLLIVADNGVNVQPSGVMLRKKNLAAFGGTGMNLKLVVESVGSSIDWSLWLSHTQNWQDVFWVPEIVIPDVGWINVDDPSGSGWTTLPAGTQYADSAWP